MNSDFVSLIVQVGNGTVIGVFVGNEESSLDIAIVGVLQVTENNVVQVDVVVVDSIVEGDHDHLWNASGVHVIWCLETTVNFLVNILLSK